MNEASLPAIDIDLVRARTRELVVGHNIRHLENVDSTNRYARDLSEADSATGTVVVAEYQDAGRGRQGRSWVAPPRSSLLFSIVFAADTGVLLSDYVMMSALAVSDGIEHATGMTTQLKWPNDLLVCERKTCGILAETGTKEGRLRVVVGVGVNVNFDPASCPGIPAGTTSLGSEAGHPIARDELLVHLLNCFDLWYRYLVQDPVEVFTAWAARLETVGREITVRDSRGSWQGVATGVRRDGGLEVLNEWGTSQVVHAGDVSIRPADFTST